MKKYYYEAKTKEEAIEKALTELNTNRDNITVKVVEEKNGLLKKLVKIEVITYNDIIDNLKNTLNDIFTLMNINANLEVRKRENNITVTIFSDNNSILIGKGGRNLSSLQTIIRQIINNQTNEHLSIILDVENYKEKKNKNLEVLAKRVAREVAKTKVEAKLDPMNSFERRIIHSTLSNDKFVYTESAGEEPNRCVVIKPKESE